MYNSDTKNECVDLEKVEKFNIPVTTHVTKSVQDRIKAHHNRLLEANTGNGTVTRSESIREILTKGLEVVEKEVHGE